MIGDNPPKIKPLDTSEEKEEKQVRTDLWPTMSLSELHRQRDVLTTKISLALDMMDKGPTDFVVQLYQKLRAAEQHLILMIGRKENGDMNDKDKGLHSEGHTSFR